MLVQLLENKQTKWNQKAHYILLNIFIPAKKCNCMKHLQDKVIYMEINI